MTRIDPKKVAEFFATHRDIKPKRRCFVETVYDATIEFQPVACCGLTSVILRKGLPADFVFTLHLVGAIQGAKVFAEKLGLPPRYAMGFMNAWDAYGTPEGDRDYKRGYRAGVKAWELTTEATK